MLTECFGFRLSAADKHLLCLLAGQQERTPADVVRRLIRQAAKEKELRPSDPTKRAKDPPVQESSAEGA